MFFTVEESIDMMCHKCKAYDECQGDGCCSRDVLLSAAKLTFIEQVAVFDGVRFETRPVGSFGKRYPNVTTLRK